jgi:hypothetical protein
MAAFINRALGLPASGVDYFDDDDDSIFENDINALAAAGITTGCGPDAFCPDGLVKREQMAAFLVRALDLTVNNGVEFADVPSSNIFRSDIQKLATAGITKGCNPPSNTRFCPSDNVTRAQMASFFARALGLQPIVPPPPIQTISFGPGTFVVPSEVPAGRYIAENPAPGCYAERLAGFSGDFDDIITNEFIADSTPLIVDITGSEAGFSTDSECGTWTNQIPVRSNTAAPLGGGYHVVGDQVAPGIWRNSSSSDTCYWERLAGFTWGFDDLITNELSDAIQIVEISASDVGFNSNRCGTWTKIG